MERRKVNTHHIWVDCGCQFIDVYEPKGYSDAIKQECLERYVNGSGFPAIERVKKVAHPTVINSVKLVGKTLPDAPEHNEIPSVTVLDELETVVGSKTLKSGCGLR